jgi:hypothetical protein
MSTIRILTVWQSVIWMSTNERSTKDWQCFGNSFKFDIALPWNDTYKFNFGMYICPLLPWRRGIVVIASTYRTEDPGFESRQGVRFFLGIYAYLCCCHNLICIVIVCTWEKINDKMYICPLWKYDMHIPFMFLKMWKHCIFLEKYVSEGKKSLQCKHLRRGQGDQLSLRKKSPKMSPKPFLSKLVFSWK